jgi:hypothetical protein
MVGYSWTLLTELVQGHSDAFITAETEVLLEGEGEFVCSLAPFCGADLGLGQLRLLPSFAASCIALNTDLDLQDFVESSLLGRKDGVAVLNGAD